MLKSAYQLAADIPQGYAGLYTQDAISGWFVLTGVAELEVLRRDLEDVRRQLATDESAIRLRITAAVERATREIKSPSLLRSLGHAIEAVRQLLSRAPFGNNVSNPWAPEGWNVTAQGQYYRQYGWDATRQAAKSVGSFVGATRPPKQATA